MTNRRMFLLVAVGLPLSAALLAIGAATDTPALEYAGAAVAIGLLAVRLAWSFHGQSRLLLGFAALMAAVVALGFVAQQLFG